MSAQRMLSITEIMRTHRQARAFIELTLLLLYINVSHGRSSSGKSDAAYSSRASRIAVWIRENAARAQSEEDLLRAVF